MVLQQAQTYVQATLGTKFGGFVFFLRMDQVDQRDIARDTEDQSWIQTSNSYPREFKRGNQVVTFTYLKRVPIRLVFEVETEEKDILYIKNTQQYGAEAHWKAHKLGIAPELLAYDDKLPG
ncbi:hypothetical protein C8J55DRAFT_494477, partial [Lentinula edodes]